jgi:hypothetical protein
MSIDLPSLAFLILVQKVYQLPLQIPLCATYVPASLVMRQPL